MLPAIKMPIKFECPSCQTVYMQKYSPNAILTSYLKCPHCQQPGQLQGTIEMHDLFKHPVVLVNYYWKDTLQRFQRL